MQAAGHDWSLKNSVNGLQNSEKTSLITVMLAQSLLKFQG